MKTLLLAAGSSTRFGSNKLLTDLDSGVPMLIQTANRIRSVTDELAVVIPAQTPELKTLCRTHSLDIIVSHNCHKGMGHSIAEAVAQTQNSNGWLIALGDMPWISPATFAQVISATQDNNTICIPCYHGKRGHPVGFPSRYGKHLMGLSGDRGARQIIQQNLPNIHNISVNDKNILIDIDRPEDLTVTQSFTKLNVI